MKKLILLVVLAVVALAGCQKAELVGPNESNGVFTASAEEFATQTKTALTLGNHVVWSSGDRIAIFRGGAVADQYQLADKDAGKSSGLFEWVAKDDAADDETAEIEYPCNVAVYPYSSGMVLKGDLRDAENAVFTVVNVALPVEQTYAGDSFDNGAFPMVAVTANVIDNSLKFKNILGAMKLQFKGNLVVKSIKVEGANGEKLSGAATFTAYANNTTPVIQMASVASTSVTLDCGDGVQLNEAKATSFYIALPPVLFQNGFTVTVTDVEDKEYVVIAKDANSILRSSILVMPEVSVKPEVGDSGNEGDYIDEYGINHGPGVEIDGVVWAPVNCGYHATDYQWGKLYQWGRKYGQGYFGGLYDNEGEIGEVSDATTPEFLEGSVSLADGQSAENKNIFFICPDYPLDWLYSQDNTLWNSGSEESPQKTEYDPCPKGWRVPTNAEFNELRQNRSSWTKNDLGQRGYWFSGSSSYSSRTPRVFLSAAGQRSDDDGETSNRGRKGYYWSSKSNAPYVLNFLLENGNCGMYSSYRAGGYSVRCVQE